MTKMIIKSGPPKIILIYFFTLLAAIGLSASPASASALPEAFIDKPDSQTKDEWLLLLLSGFITVPHLFNPPVVTLYPVSSDRTPPPEEGATALPLSMPSDSTSEWPPIDDLSLNLETINQAMADRIQSRLPEEEVSQESDDEIDLEAVSDITAAIMNYMSERTTHSLMPLIMNPPSWSEVLCALQDFYQVRSRQVRCSLDTRLHRILLRGGMFLTQIPTRETIEGIYQIIRYFQAALRERFPDKPLVISGLAVGNAIIERAIVERFRRENGNHSFSVTGHFIQLEEGVFLHCSDSYQKNNPNIITHYTSTPMLPIAELDYTQAVETISEAMPEAFILPFASWIPSGKNEWLSNLAEHHPAVIGFIHLQDLFACGYQSPLTRIPSHGRIRGRFFDRRRFNLLGWGANDALQGPGNKILLQTTLEVHFPDSFNAPELPSELLYTDKFREDNFKKVELSEPPEDSDSDD